MTDELRVLQGHLCDLAARADRTGTFYFSDFLGLGEQSAYREIERELSYAAPTPFGGAAECERVVLRFGNPEELGYELPFPIVALMITPRAPKFAEQLTHRDVLGSLMNLGITRDTLGDIVIREGEVYLFCLERVCDFIVNSLTRIRHTDVKVAVVDALPEGSLYRTQTVKIQAVGERLDAIVAKVYRISREDSLALFARGLVFQNGLCVQSHAKAPKAGDVISVRGYGRFRYVGFVSESKKGKMNLVVEQYV